MMGHLRKGAALAFAFVFGLFLLTQTALAQQDQGISSADEKVTEHAGVKPKRILRNERSWVGRYTRAPHGEDKGVDLYYKGGTQLNSSILNWEYQAGYKFRESFWQRLQHEWFPDLYFSQSYGFKRRTYEVWTEVGSRWRGDMDPSNRGNYEMVQAARHSDYIGPPLELVQKLDNQAIKAEGYANYVGRSLEIGQKLDMQARKAEEYASWTGHIISDKEEKERKKAEQLSDWTGNYHTNKEEVQKKKAQQISEYEGNTYTNKQSKQERSAKDARNYEGTLRISRWYLISHDSKSKYRKIPKGKRDKKEKDMWYD